MSAYTYQTALRALWDHSVKTYQDGNRDAESYFSTAQARFLASIGATAQEIFDFAEDFVSSGEPDFDTFAMVTDRRRSYFLQVQGGERSERIVLNEDLPPKDAAVEGVEWLPRIIVKARAKLQGEMNPDLMYGCGGDRRFLKSVDIHLAEFLGLVERNFANDAAIIAYVLARQPVTV